MKPMIHCGAIDTSSGEIKTKDEALKVIDALRKHVDRLCEAKKVNMLFIVTLSISDKGTVTRTRYGSRISSSAKILPPHLHITYLTEKYSTMEKEIKNYIINTLGLKCWSNPIKSYGHLKRRMPYCFTQGIKLRTVNTCSEEFAMRYAGDFVALAEEANAAVKNGKRVFSRYKGKMLGADHTVFDFHSHIKHQTVELNNEVWTNKSNESILSTSVVDSQNDVFLPDNPQKSKILGIFPPANDTVPIPIDTAMKL